MNVCFIFLYISFTVYGGCFLLVFSPVMRFAVTNTRSPVQILEKTL